MARFMGPNGPIQLDPASYDYDDLRTRLDTALAGDDAGRYDRVLAAIAAAKNGGSITPAPVFTTAPTIAPTSGTAGDTFTASNGVATNTTSYARRWLLSGSALGTGSTFVPASAGNLVLEVTATGPGGSVIATSSAVTVDAAPTPAPVFSVQPSIAPSSGAAGDTFTATNGTASNTTSYARRWLLGGTPIGTGSTVVPGTAGNLVLEVTATGPGGSTVATSSAVTVAAAPTPAPVFSVQPSIAPSSGNAGDTFTATDGTASDTTSYARRWLLSGTPIGTGATVAPGSAGSLVLEVTATGPGGNTIATSSAVTVSAAPAVPVTSAAITGDLIDRHTASVGAGNVYQANEAIPIPMNGSVLRIVLDADHGTLDLTKIEINVSRPGSLANGTATTVNEKAYVSGVLRRAWPNNASAYTNPDVADPANTFYLVIDDMIQAADTVTSVLFNAGFYTGSSSFSFNAPTNNSTLAYEPVIARAVNRPYERITGAMDVEITAVHEYARNNRQVARIEAWLVDKDGNVGTVASSTLMERSIRTPETSWMPAPNAPPAPVFKMTVPITKAAGGGDLVDGECRLFWKAYPWCGVVTESNVIGYDWPTYSLPKSQPVILDVANVHQPIYVWWNQNNTAGASPAVQTTSADPGSAGSYGTPAAALAAVRAYNNANRGHDDISGGVLMLRDVAGSTLGADAGAYQVPAAWGSTTTYPPGIMPFRVRRASATTPSDAVRWRSLDGLSSSAKLNPNKIIFEGIRVDSLNKATGDNIAINSGGPATANTSVTGSVYTFMKNCDIYESQAASGANNIISNVGWYYEEAVRWVDQKLGIATGSNNYGGRVMTIGSVSVYSATNAGGSLVGVFVIGCYSGNNQPKARSNLLLPSADGGLYVNIWAEKNLAGNAAIYLGDADHEVTIGWGISNVFIRTVGTANASFAVAADSSRRRIKNVVVQNVTLDSNGASGSSGRWNSIYQDQGFTFIPKKSTRKYCAVMQSNVKGEAFIAPENANGAAAWVAGGIYLYGDMVTDGNATTGSRLFYAALQNHTAGATMATDLADTTKWRPLGAVYGVAYNQQPLRTGNWQYRHGCRNFGNIMSESAGGNTTYSPTSWFGDMRGRGEVIKSDAATWWVARELVTPGPAGNYRPNPAGPLVNKVPAGMANMPFDVLGTPRLNDGTGAAGALERVA